MSQLDAIDLILVPQGAEYRAVTSGLRKAHPNRPLPAIAIPVGQMPVTSFLTDLKLPSLEDECDRPLNIVVLGLCGGLAASVAVGQRVVPDLCLAHLLETATESIPSQQSFSEPLCRYLKQSVLPPNESIDSPNVLLSSDRAVCLAEQKQQLERSTGASIIDMEGAAVLSALSDRHVSVAMLRVVSDDCWSDLPDLNAALKADGSLSFPRLAMQMVRHPTRALRLIASSLRALQELTLVAEELGLAVQSNVISPKIRIE